MKITLKNLTYCLALGLTTVTNTAAWGSETSVSPMVQSEPELVFGVKAFNLSTQVDILTQKTRAGVLEILAKSIGPNNSMQTLQSAVERAQRYVDQIAPGAFVLRLPAQTFDDSGEVQITLSPVLQEVKVVGGSEENATKILASLPATLQKGSVMSEGTWPSAAALSMFNHHPLKITAVNYQITRDQPVTAVVTIKEPWGKSQTAVMVDSYGNDVIGRGLLSVSHVQSDLFMLEDTLSFSALTSLIKSSQVGVGSLHYSVMDTPALTQHSVGITYSASKVATPFLSFGNLNGEGSFAEISYRQTRYLDCCQAMEISNARLFADLALNKSNTLTTYQSAILVDSSVSTLPLTLGIEGLMQHSPKDKDGLLKDFSALIKSQVVLNQLGSFGLSDQSDFNKARFGAGNSAALRISVDSKTTLDQLQLSAQLTTQYTVNKLLPTGQMSIAGDRNGARGFVNAALLGDKASVLRLTADPLALRDVWMDFSFQPYAFYDVGHKSGGNDNRTVTVSSTGLGIRVVSLASSGLSLDAFAAKKLQGSTLDLVPGTTRAVDTTTYWLAATYRF